MKRIRWKRMVLTIAAIMAFFIMAAPVLTVCAEGEAAPAYTVSADQTEYKVAPDSVLTLQVHVDAPAGMQLEYYWLKWWLDEKKEWHYLTVEGATGPSLVTEKINYQVRYACHVKNQDDQEQVVDFDVSVENHMELTSDPYSQTVFIGEKADMRVLVSADHTEDLRYQWYSFEESDGESSPWVPIPGANASTYQTPPVTKSTTYLCNVWDKFGTEMGAYFNVNVHIQLNPRQGLYIVKNGERAVLEVETVGADPSELQYQWYQVYWEPKYQMIEIEGATSERCVTGPITSQSSFCCVATGASGATCETNVEVMVSNHLQAISLTPKTEWQVGEKATLQVKVSADDLDGVTYQWRREREVYDADGNVNYENEKLESNGSDTFVTEPITDSWTYVCTITDRFGTVEAVYFYVNAENHLRISKQPDYYLTISPNETKRLVVKSRADHAGDVFYVWMKDYDVIKTGSENYLGVKEAGYYECRCVDSYGVNKLAAFNVGMENHFSVEAMSDEVVVVPLGGSATLKLNVQADDAEGINYYWFRSILTCWGEGEFYYVSGGVPEQGDSLQLNNVTKDATYWCMAEDAYGNRQNVEFSVFVDKEQKLAISADKGTMETVGEDTVLTVADGEKVTLQVSATGFDDGVTYLWSEGIYKELGPAGQWTFWDLATNKITFTATADGLKHSYLCTVMDGQGHVQKISVQVFVPDCKIQFQANGGSGTMPKVDGQTGRCYVLPKCKFMAPQGMIFAGWDVNGELYEEEESILPAGNVTVKAVWKANDLVIAKRSLRLQDTIAIDFKISKDDIAGKYHDPYLLVTQNGKTSKLTNYSEDGGLLIFTYRVAPQMMGDEVTAVPHAINAGGEDVRGAEMTYSVKEYCYNMLGKDEWQSAYYAPFRRLLVDILRYGDAAQTYAGYKTKVLVGKDLTESQLAMGTPVNAAMTYNSVKKNDYATVDDALATIEKATLYLEAAVNVQFKFSADDLTNLRIVITDDEDCSHVIAEYPAKATQIDKNGLYFVNVSKLNAGEMRKTIYATVMEGNKKVSNTYRYSIESYVSSMKGRGVANLDELLDAMMRYGDSAKEYATGR